MPLLKDTSYQPPFLLSNKHIHSIYPVFFRKIKGVEFSRERITLRDSDFLDLDIAKEGNEKVAILIHGFEGSTSSVYIRAITKTYLANGWDVVGMNLRGCSGEANWLFRSYHSGESDDLDEVIKYVISHHKYEQIALTGFSLGGNILLKYLGEQGKDITKEVKAAVSISAPCDLSKAENALSKVYAHWFLKSLIPKTKEKLKTFPDNILGSTMPKLRSVRDFDDYFTAPVHGFKNVDDYYEKCSAISFVSGIRIPTLLISALDDPFLAPECFPFEEARNSDYFFLKSPKRGGHVAFAQFKASSYWAEEEAANFLAAYI
ncbi:YheT family hydrolase [Chondrinema litorale]|uniref:YheT family hydrolase n=1 Tax=Chondrinema litorale TaxID=2994555 RepID=UPI002543A6C4|nr:alpha/beta fold hydrolase [Chondrinema litorale]UZR92514.1 alpha/beta fold hydrolase [Chondrinema litorale]